MNIDLQLSAPQKRRGETRQPSQAGHTIIEVLVAFSFLIVGAFGFLKVIVSTNSASDVNFEVAQAKEAARAQIELLMSLDFQEAFTRFNASNADDPVGVVSPGANFAVDNLAAVDGDADGMAGEIIFPTRPGADTQIREDVVNQALGCPMDLNGDQVVDALDHSADALVIPVIVRITWQGRSGACTTQFRTVLGGLQ